MCRVKDIRKGSRTQNGDAFKLFQNQQVFVASDNVVGFGGYCQTQHFDVIGIATNIGREREGILDSRVFAQKSLNTINDARGKFYLQSKGFQDFI